MAVTLANVQADTGEVYDAVNNGTTAVTSMIALAGSVISDITGTVTGYDTAIRFTADMFVCIQVLGGVDPVSKTVGGLNIGAKDLRSMRDMFEMMAKNNLKVKGFNVEGLSVKIEMVNS